MTIRTKLYLFAISLITLIVINQLIINHQATKLETIAHILNMSGRQRMFSQNITKNTIKIKNAQANETPFFEERRKVKDMILVFEKIHHGLKERKENLGFKGENSAYINNMFKDIEPSFLVIKENTNKLINSNRLEDLGIYAAVVENNNEAFLTRMNSIVNQYEEDFKSEIKSLAKIFLFINTLIVTLIIIGMLYISKKIQF
jgi:hypothetical protein